VLLSGCEISLIYFGQVLLICLEDIIDIDCPKSIVSELLPFFFVAEFEDVLLEELLQRSCIRFAYLRLLELLLCNPCEKFQKLVSLQSIWWILFALFELLICCDEKSVDCCLNDVGVQALAVSDEVS